MNLKEAFKKFPKEMIDEFKGFDSRVQHLV